MTNTLTSEPLTTCAKCGLALEMRSGYVGDRGYVRYMVCPAHWQEDEAEGHTVREAVPGDYEKGEAA